MTALQLGADALDFQLPAVDGKNYSLKDFSNRPVLALIFSCNHCPYVLAWEDRMIALQRDYGERGFQIVAINANDASKKPKDDFPHMVEHAKEKEFNFVYLHDESQEVAHAYGAERTPEVFLFDADRTLRYHGAIDDNYEDPTAVQQSYLASAVNALLAGNAPVIKETAPVGCTVKWK
ncbi:MAG: hypothetical protein GFH27_549289n139 [Chloroflexi bacterium AL-W]|nr:hypothetical protein [Chloroflexi bacterium AL-N1]NOK66872.1 hypothetical protein [Chloroflexi bacterium AL-N10]NOK74836.1 hypothetical protein [Chloroflexi bacterium AL-N5]NOK81474.1 hypothetical protein [Chloroflexi bacterium AL-W]NOK88944.1 hypothetical protein [Chloroflexi bacterium AL-N15]